MVYPPQCMSCGETVITDGSLCPLCWREAEFITGIACGLCGAPLPGSPDASSPDASSPEVGSHDVGAVERNPSGEGPSGAILRDDLGHRPQADNSRELRCDECLRYIRPWQAGRAVLTYRGTGRRLALMLKHGDRLDLAPRLGEWLAGVVTPLIQPDMIVAPVPLHLRRMVKRKYNQAALLAGYVARHHRLEFQPSLLKRSRNSPSQDHRSFEDRFANQQGAIALPARQIKRVAGRPVLLVDDVMASGATLCVAAESLLAQGAGPISVAVLARAVKDP